MKKVKLKFIDCYQGHKPEEDKYYKILSQYYDVELSDNPDYIIDGGLGHEHLDSKYDKCVKLISIARAKKIFYKS